MTALDHRQILFLLLILFSLAFLVSSCGSEPDAVDVSESLLDEITALTAQYPEAHISIVAYDLSSGALTTRNAYELLPAGSLIHLPIMIETFRQVSAGHITLLDTLDWRKAEPTDTIAAPVDTARVDTLETSPSMPVIQDLLQEMIITSSDSAAQMLLRVVTADSVARTASRQGATGIYLRPAADTTLILADSVDASTILSLLTLLGQGRAVNPRMDHEMINLMMQHDESALTSGGLPPEAVIAQLTAQGETFHHDAGIVYPRTGGPYILILLTAGLEDDAQAAGAEIARIVHRHLRPTS